MIKLLGLIFIVAFCMVNAQEDVEFPIRAFALIYGKVNDPTLKSSVSIRGIIHMIQKNESSPVDLILNITSIPRTNNVWNKKVGSHFHKFGVADIKSESSIACASTGPHYNPKSAIPSENLESGELGNFLFEPENGRLISQMSIPKIKLFGPESMIGRSIVFHERPDDVADIKKVKKTNSTTKPIPRIACGTISFEKF